MRKFIFIVVATIIVGIVVVSIPKSKKGEPVSQEVEKEDTIDSIASILLAIIEKGAGTSVSFF